MKDAPGRPSGEIALFETPDGEVRLDVRLDRETVWLSLFQMVEFFGRDKSVISRHLRNVFTSGELERAAVVAENAATATDDEGTESDPSHKDLLVRLVLNLLDEEYR